MRKQIGLLLILIAISTSISVGQEVLLDLQTIPLKKVVKPKEMLLKSKAKSTLTLPFFDDFAKGTSYPDPNNWIDSYVIINQTYAINPPTIGVATFDAIDQYGQLYSNLTSASSPCDTLTSKIIDLSLQSNVFFSFQYQPKGLGKEPSETDSLVLEFFSKDDTSWIRVWSASPHFSTNAIVENNRIENKVATRKSTNIGQSFFKVMLPIMDDRFLKDSFQLRFINYASLPANTQVPSLRGNGDQWHIDLVYLNQGRYDTDTLLNDITFSEPLKSFLKNYESIPWKHFAEATTSELTDPYSFTMQYKNQGPITWNITRRYVVTDQSGFNPPYAFSGGAENISPYQTVDFIRNYEYTFASNWDDSAKFDMESYLITDFDDSTRYLRWNDTIRYTQRFINYYAYDDGSAENGYGIYGEGSDNGMVAIKYHTYAADSLKGIMMYFNRTLKDDNQLYDPEAIKFYLTVWSDANGTPGSIIYQDKTTLPHLTDSLNKFAFYPIKEKIKISGDFWIGWKNTTTDFLNVGFDLNNVHNNKLYYNLSGNWVQSQFQGSLMMRPVFGYLTSTQTGIVVPKTNPHFTIFPNPASNQVSINIPENVRPERIRIVNLAGQVVVNKTYDSNSIDVSNLSTGIYLFQLTMMDKTTSTQKLVIIK